MAGGASHKDEWGSVVERYAKIYLYRRGLRGRALYTGRRIGSALREGRLARELGRRVLARLGSLGRHVRARSLGRARLHVKGHDLEVEVAVSAEDFARGLALRYGLEAHHGMLFVVGGREAEFWMKDTYLELDLAYLDAAGRIVEIHRMQPRSEVPVRSAGPVAYALEVSRGWFARHGVSLGDRVEGAPLG